MASHEEQKEHARRVAEEHMKHNVVGDAIESVKDAFNTRANESTGRYYVKGKKAHKESEFFGGRDLQDDPNL